MERQNVNGPNINYFGIKRKNQISKDNRLRVESKNSSYFKREIVIAFDYLVYGFSTGRFEWVDLYHHQRRLAKL